MRRHTGLALLFLAALSLPACVGEPGVEGIKGEQGQKGDKGDVGPTGPQGEKGEQGQTGMQGEKGDQGIIGPQGQPGQQGQQGLAGPQGIPGPVGPHVVLGGNGTIGSVDTVEQGGATLVDTSYVGNGEGGFIETRHWNDGKPLVRMSTLVNSGYLKGVIAVYNSGNPVAGLTGDGLVWGQSKAFVVDHPDRPGMAIVYTAVEGPEAAMYVRGTARLAGGRAEIPLPDHFARLAADEGMTATLTPHAATSRGLAREQLDPRRLVVRELAGGTGSYEFDYAVYAVRRGFEDYRVVRPWSEFAGDQPSEHRSQAAGEKAP